MSWVDSYKQKLVPAEEAAGIIQSGDRVYYGGNAAIPRAIPGLRVRLRRGEHLLGGERRGGLLARRALLRNRPRRLHGGRGGRGLRHRGTLSLGGGAVVSAAAPGDGQQSYQRQPARNVTSHSDHFRISHQYGQVETWNPLSGWI